MDRGSGSDIFPDPDHAPGDPKRPDPGDLKRPDQDSGDPKRLDRTKLRSGSTTLLLTILLSL